MAFDIFLNTVTHDIDISGGKLSFTSTLADSCAQRILIRLLAFKEEWVFNTDFGIPYYQQIFKKGVTREVVDGVFRNEIVKVPEVTKIISYNSSINAGSREYTATFTVQAKDGSEITLSI